MNNFLNGKSAAMVLALSLVNVTAAFAQDDNSSAKEEGNRNVMLNAASANGPREIQIGLPSADVNVWRMVCLLLTLPILILSIPSGVVMQV